MHYVSLILSSLISISFSLNILLYSPRHFHSHINFISNIRDALVEAGHNVTAIVPFYDPTTVKYGFHETREIRIPWSGGARQALANLDAAFSNIWYTNQENPLGSSDALPGLASMMGSQCDATLNHPGLLELLKEEQFDVGFTEQFDYCGVGLMHYANVKTLITASSSIIWDHMQEYTGVPISQHYVPSSSGVFSDKMSVKEKILNYVFHWYDNHVFYTMADYVQHAYVRKFGKHFPNLMQLNHKASIVITNSDPIIDFPRPTLHKIVDIGGIGYSKSDHSKKLNENFKRLISLRPYTVVVSFGSVAKSATMPDDMRSNILETFSKFPDTTFIWKYEDKDVDFAKKYPNVVFAPWLPQKQLFASGKVQIFITHCGMGSVSESMRNGVPLIGIPLFGDQMRNARMAERHESTIIVNKLDIITGGNSLEEAIRKIKLEKSFSEKAHRIAEMYRKRPFTPEELLVKNVEFAGNFGYLEIWDPQSRHMNFFEYYQLDILSVLLLVASSFIFVIYLLLRLLIAVFRKLRSQKVKTN